MPECRGCAVALAPHELDLCRDCWDATERDDGDEDYQAAQAGQSGSSGAVQPPAAGGA